MNNYVRQNISFSVRGWQYYMRDQSRGYKPDYVECALGRGCYEFEQFQKLLSRSSLSFFINHIHLCDRYMRDRR